MNIFDEAFRAFVSLECTVCLVSGVATIVYLINHLLLVESNWSCLYSPAGVVSVHCAVYSMSGVSGGKVWGVHQAKFAKYLNVLLVLVFLICSSHVTSLSICQNRI